MLKCLNIKECPEALDAVMDIIYDQWGTFFRRTKQERLDEIKNAIAKNLQFPQMFVMKDNEIIVGSFTIKEMPLEDNTLVPSLWYVIIKPKYRGKGYGRKLLDFIDQELQKYKKVYLVTEHTGLYEKIGFIYVKDIDHNGQVDRLYYKNY